MAFYCGCDPRTRNRLRWTIFGTFAALACIFNIILCVALPQELYVDSEGVIQVKRARPQACNDAMQVLLSTRGVCICTTTSPYNFARFHSLSGMRDALRAHASWSPVHTFVLTQHCCAAADLVRGDHLDAAMIVYSIAGLLMSLCWIAALIPLCVMGCCTRNPARTELVRYAGCASSSRLTWTRCNCGCSASMPVDRAGGLCCVPASLTQCNAPCGLHQQA
jgi:hypothetical protein